MDNRTPYGKYQRPVPDSQEAQEMKIIPYRELIGTLLWLANCTRPDIAYAVGTLAKFTSNPGILHWKALLRVLKYLERTVHYCIRYRRDITQDDGVEVTGYSRGILPNLNDFEC